MRITAEDIYVLSYSSVSALPHKKLSMCLKQNIGLDATHISEPDVESQDIHDLHTLTEMYLKIQDKVSSLEGTVKLQSAKIESLENQPTQTKLELVKSKVNTNPKEISMDQIEDGQGEQLETELGTLPNPSQSDDDTPKVNPPTYAAAVRNETEVEENDGDERQIVIPESQRAPSHKPSTALPGRNNEDPPFRHSANERKNIQRGKVNLRAAVRQGSVRCSSNRDFHISAANQDNKGSYLVYVGNLQVDTMEETLRKHLSTVKIKDVADIISLKGRNSDKSTAFCVSFNNESEMGKMFQDKLWPLGVKVRPFYPSKRYSNNSRPQQHQIRIRPSYANSRLWHNKFKVLQYNQSRRNKGHEWQSNHFYDSQNNYRDYQHDRDNKDFYNNVSDNQNNNDSYRKSHYQARFW